MNYFEEEDAQRKKDRWVLQELARISPQLREYSINVFSEIQASLEKLDFEGETCGLTAQLLNIEVKIIKAIYDDDNVCILITNTETGEKARHLFPRFLNNYNFDPIFWALLYINSLPEDVETMADWREFAENLQRK